MDECIFERLHAGVRVSRSMGGGKKGVYRSHVTLHQLTNLRPAMGHPTDFVPGLSDGVEFCPDFLSLRRIELDRFAVSRGGLLLLAKF